MTSAVIVDAVRTGLRKGKPGGSLAGVHPLSLLAGTIRQPVERSAHDLALIGDVISGRVSRTMAPALNIARTVALAARFPEAMPGTSADRQCGSSQQAAHFAARGTSGCAHQALAACCAGSMSRIPMGASSQRRHPMAPHSGRYSETLVNQVASAEGSHAGDGEAWADRTDGTRAIHRTATVVLGGGRRNA
jgi:acetyl-CoA acyltransferase